MQDSLNAEQERLLVEQAQQDPAAFRELYRAYFPRIFAYVSYRVVRVQDAEDLVADIFLKAVRELHAFQYRGPASFAAWLFRIAHTQVREFHRLRRSLADQLQLEALLNLQDSTPLLDSAATQHEQIGHLRRLISTLSPRRQDIITLKIFGRLRNRDIADILELDERLVAAHVCRALEDLHQKYLADPQWANEENSDEWTR